MGPPETLGCCGETANHVRVCEGAHVARKAQQIRTQLHRFFKKDAGVPLVRQMRSRVEPQRVLSGLNLFIMFQAAGRSSRSIVHENHCADHAAQPLPLEVRGKATH